MRFLGFFAANIRNPHTRRAYALDMELDQAILHIGDERALFGREHVASSSPLFCQQQGAETVQPLRPSADFLRGSISSLDGCCQKLTKGCAHATRRASSVPFVMSH